MANSTGRKMRLIFSMPPCTPKYTVATVPIEKSPERRIWRQPLLTTDAKIAPVCTSAGNPVRLHPSVFTK